MSNITYSKADLMWEATRRNEDYKNDYAQKLKQYRDDNKNNLDISIVYLPYPSSDRWGIAMPILKENRSIIRILGWLDPSVDIDKIKKEINSGAPALSVHPYAHTLEYNMTNPNIYYHHIYQRSQKNNYFFEHHIKGLNPDTDIYVCIKKYFIRDRVLLLIDPTSDDKMIMKSIKKVKKQVLNDIKKELESFKQKGVMAFYPRDIDKYIGWLKKYDEIIEYHKKEKGNDGLICENGALIIPEDFSFGDLVPNDTPGNKYEGQRKAYKDAYNGAVKLIQNTPNIMFSPSRS